MSYFIFKQTTEQLGELIKDLVELIKWLLGIEEKS